MESIEYLPGEALDYRLPTGLELEQSNAGKLHLYDSFEVDSYSEGDYTWDL